MPEKWLRTREAAELWRVTPWTIRRWVKKGVVMGVKLGPRTVRVLVMSDEPKESGQDDATGATK